MTSQPEGWRKSTHSGHEGDCVEVGRHVGTTAVRDTKARTRGRLELGPTPWATFLTGLKRA
ncbi:DUF397 domain-containing protein [Streptomyces sp. SID3343]|uniref:DUF397 domain-containing protein n=1 Tax=Streptomyces sp. SID3343 TaxID=2690260 RepID=UPI00136F6061|nr:DUF397 domain-containing protein [Streptomyces sp. SID3343]MYW00576.1 DUF397 domain-containing protein [Streptomyces sp. SID3343]